MVKLMIVSNAHAFYSSLKTNSYDERTDIVRHSWDSLVNLCASYGTRKKVCEFLRPSYGSLMTVLQVCSAAARPFCGSCMKCFVFLLFSGCKHCATSETVVWTSYGCLAISKTSVDLCGYTLNLSAICLRHSWPPKPYEQNIARLMLKQALLWLIWTRFSVPRKFVRQRKVNK